MIEIRFSRAVGKLRSSALARNTLWSFVGQLGRLILQTLYFVVITRILGAEGYGLLAALIAYVAVFFPLAGWGSGNLLVMNVARNPAAFPIYWGNALLIIAVTSILCGVAVISAKSVVLPDASLHALVLLGVSDLVGFKVVETVSQVFQALDRMVLSITFGLLTFATRLVAVGAYALVSGEPNVDSWIAWYATTNLAAAMFAVFVVSVVVGPPQFDFDVLLKNVKPGGQFAVAQAASSVYSDTDKIMLARLGTLDATGNYAAAYRVLGMAFVPVRSLLFASYGRFFRQGQAGVAGTVKFAAKILPVPLGWSAVAGIGMALMAPFIPALLGNDYESAVEIIRWLSVLPVIQTLHYVGADALTGAGHQGTRTTVQIGTAVVNVVLNLFLIPELGWQGAVIATVIAEGTMAITIWLLIWRLWQFEGNECHQ